MNSPLKIGVEGPGISSSPISRNLTQQNATLPDCLHVPEPAVSNILPATVLNAEELDFEETNIIALLKRKNGRLTCVSDSRQIY